MATATTALNFTWNDPCMKDLFRDFNSFGCNIKPARTIKPNGSFPSLTRSFSVGSPTFPRRKPPTRRKSKSVHFADSKGLALVSVSTFNEEKELHEQFSKARRTTFKQSAKSKCGYDSSRPKKSIGGDKILSEKITKQLAWQKVCVENAKLLRSGVRGDVYVANLAYEKQVKARFTFDSWQTSREIDGEFHSNCTKDIDKFVFEIPIAKERAIKNFKIEFAVSYTVLGDTFWDNNNGFNYHALFANDG